MLKNDLARIIANEFDLPIYKVEEIADRLLEVIELCVACGEPVMLRGFGRFELREKGEVVICNPKTGERVQVPSRKGIGFVPSSSLNRRLNEG